jgi:putative DNA primase/helicase
MTNYVPLEEIERELADFDTSSPKAIRFKAVRACALGPPSGEDWLIKGLLPKEGVGTFFGSSGAYKSFSAINIALHIATGEPWSGRKVAQADAVYVASEGAAGAAKRISGAMEANGAADPPLYLISKAVNFGTGTQDANTLIADLEAQGITPGFIGIDTLSASMAGGDENGGGMAMFLMNCQTLSQHFGCFVMPLHHVGHGENGGRRERGHSSLIGNVDVRILCERPENRQATLEWVKVKDGPDGIKFRLELDVVDFGHDRDGDPITTLAVRSGVEVDAQPKLAKKAIIPPQERLLMDTVELALIEAGRNLRPFADGAEVKAVAEDAIRSRYYARLAEKPLPDETPEKLAQRQRKAFRRSLNAALQAMRLVAAEREGERIIWMP